MSFKTQLFIDGKWVDPVLKGTFATFQPTTGEVLAHVSNATAEDVEIAVASAKACLYGPNWGNGQPPNYMFIFLTNAFLRQATTPLPSSAPRF
jgi:hypothetical protein